MHYSYLFINIYHCFEGNDHDGYPEDDPGASEEKLSNPNDETSKEKMPFVSDPGTSKEQSSYPKNERSKETMLVVPKRKKKSNLEKSLDVVFDKFVQSAADDFERLVCGLP